MSSFTASGVVALTTDFGLADPYVGSMKAVLLTRAPRAVIVDVTHAVPPQGVRLGAFFLARVWRYFPAGTVHVAVVDPGVGSTRRLILGLDHGQCFLGPDNGLLGWALSEAAQVFELDAARFALPGASRTFHGRDVLAPAAAELCAGLDPSHAVRAPLQDLLRLARSRIEPRDGRIAIDVLHVDHYGNVILDAGPEDVPADLERCDLDVGGRKIPFVSTYADVERGAPLALVDSFGALEIAVRDGSASDTFALRPGDRVILRKHS